MAYENIPPGELILTPEHEMFNFILNTSPPPGWQDTIDSDFQGMFIVRADTGLMEPADAYSLRDYVEGGELDSLPDPLEQEDSFEISYLV